MTRRKRLINAAHKNDKADTQVKTVADTKGAEHDKAYDTVIKST
jgi:hypothetical protein